jgi:hypothetical protein
MLPQKRFELTRSILHISVETLAREAYFLTHPGQGADQELSPEPVASAFDVNPGCEVHIQPAVQKCARVSLIDAFLPLSF